MALKERFSNPVAGDTVRLRLYSYNSNAPANIEVINKIEIFYKEQDGSRRLVETIPGSAVENTDVGHYMVDVELETEKFVIGDYFDVWTMQPLADQEPQTVTNYFAIYPNLWYTTATPVVYDFKFHFQPNRLRKGSRQFLIVETIPNVARASDLCRYYENLIIGAQIKISIEQSCGPCVPQERDLRMIVEDELIELREGRLAYYQLDTEDLDCGIYNVSFKLEFGGNIYVSDRMQLEIY